MLRNHRPLLFQPHVSTSHPHLISSSPPTTSSFKLVSCVMAPTKNDAEKGEKEAKLTPDQSTSLMLDYLRKQNRPYSATDISANLKNRVTKAAAAKFLKDMYERSEIEGRASGKQWVYHTIQVGVDWP